MVSSLPIVYKIASVAKRFPNKTAFVIGEHSYSYQTLFLEVFSIYQRLKEEEIQESRIGVFCQNDIHTYASILAINLYGAAFVPLNPQFPEQKLNRIIDLAQIHLVLNLNENQNKWRVTAWEITQNERNAANVFDFDPIQKQDEAYLLFTSGTTGAPKGVVIHHDQMQALFSHFLSGNHHAFTETDRFIQPAELSFDLSIFTVFMPLLVGASCHVPSEKGIRYIEILKSILREKITVVTLVPSTLALINKQLSHQGFPEVKTSLFIGDRLLQEECEKWQKHCPNSKLYNYYGPTEATVMCGFYSWNKENETTHSVVPIGSPFPNVNYQLLDAENKPVKRGETGELALSGIQVIEAYLNNEHEDRFLNLCHENGTERYYLTGDLAFQDEEACYHFVGRTDSQVKINGFRIELAEIEEIIRPTLNTNFHLMKNELPNKLDELVLFVEGEKRDLSEMKKALNQNLPAYMHPNREVYLDQFPLNRNDKLDRITLKKML